MKNKINKSSSSKELMVNKREKINLRYNIYHCESIDQGEELCFGERDQGRPEEGTARPER